MQSDEFIYNYDLLLTKSSKTEAETILPLLKKTYDEIFNNVDDETQALIDVINNEDIKEILDYANYARKRCSNFVVFGIGGSSLGTNVIFRALKPQNYNELPRKVRRGPRFYIEDNVDPESFNSLLESLNLRKTIFCIVSKSGETIETLAQFYAILEKVKEEVGEKWAEHFVIITGNNGAELNKIALENSIKTFEIPSKLGGRFSVLSAVGLLPSAVLGVDIQALLDGARQMLNIARNEDFLKNAPLLSAVLNYTHYAQNKNIAVLLTYASALGSFGDWFCQLWAESLGKRNLATDSREGQTPLTAIGTSVQHSQFQLYIDGPQDKIITVLGVESFRKNIEYSSDILNKKISFEHLIKTERDASIQVLSKNGIPCEIITLSNINEKTLGKLFVFYLFKTIFSGKLLNVNPYGQPAVESVKQTIKDIL